MFACWCGYQFLKIYSVTQSFWYSWVFYLNNKCTWLLIAFDFDVHSAVLLHNIQYFHSSPRMRCTGLLCRKPRRRVSRWWGTRVSRPSRHSSLRRPWYSATCSRWVKLRQWNSWWRVGQLCELFWSFVWHIVVFVRTIQYLRIESQNIH